jgi:hypothetical protein
MGGFRTTRRKPSEHNSLLQQLKGISNSNTLEWRNFTQDFRIPGTTEQQESSELPRIRAGQAETGRRGRRRRGMGARRSPHTSGRPRPPSPPAPKRSQETAPPAPPLREEIQEQEPQPVPGSKLLQNNEDAKWAQDSAAKRPVSVPEPIQGACNWSQRK